MNLEMLSLTRDSAEKINSTIDIGHSFFMLFSLYAVIVLFESFLPNRTAYENTFDRFYTYFKLIFITLFNFIALSQAIFGGCIIYFPQTWFNRKYLGLDEPYAYGLFAREYISADWQWALRLFYILGAALVLWRSVVFIKKRFVHTKK